MTAVKCILHTIFNILQCNHFLCMIFLWSVSFQKYNSPIFLIFLHLYVYMYIWSSKDGFKSLCIWTKTGLNLVYIWTKTGLNLVYIWTRTGLNLVYMNQDGFKSCIYEPRWVWILYIWTKTGLNLVYELRRV